MESRTIYNHPSVCRLRRARFHGVILKAIVSVYLNDKASGPCGLRGECRSTFEMFYVGLK